MKTTLSSIIITIITILVPQSAIAKLIPQDANTSLSIAGSSGTIQKLRLTNIETGKASSSEAIFNPDTKKLTWTPDCNDSGTYRVKFKATKGDIKQEQTVTITVNDTCPPPKEPVLHPTETKEPTAFQKLINYVKSWLEETPRNK